MAGGTYLLKSATFGTAITGLTNFSISKGGSPVDFNNDASVNIQDVFVDNLAIDVTIETNDISTIDSIGVGDTQSTATLLFQKRATGTGAVDGSDITATLTKPVITSVELSAPHEGTGSGSVTMRAVSVAFS